jgi:hypothetical protein
VVSKETSLYISYTFWYLDVSTLCSSMSTFNELIALE